MKAIIIFYFICIFTTLRCNHTCALVHKYEREVLLSIAAEGVSLAQFRNIIYVYCDASTA